MNFKEQQQDINSSGAGAEREGKRTLDVGGGETEDDAERKQGPTRIRDYARSSREAEDGVHGPRDGAECP